MLNEQNIIDILKFDHKFIGGIGDDAAIIPIDSRKSYIITKDLLVEDIHFDLNYYDPESLAIKAINVNLSDIAAMGGQSKFILLGISIPKNFNQKYLNDFLKYFSSVCKNNKVILIGGDTTSSPDKLFVSITAIGLIKNSNIKLRSQARVSDIICLAGNIGYAHLGLHALQTKIPDNYFKQHALRPKALINEAIWLGKRKEVTAMMDSSDGLYIDLKKLCDASGKTCNINLDIIPISNEFSEYCYQNRLDPIEILLTGGEDYGLIFTIKESEFNNIKNDFEKKFKYEIKRIGVITENSQIKIIKDNKNFEFNYRSFSHFGEN